MAACSCERGWDWVAPLDGDGMVMILRGRGLPFFNSFAFLIRTSAAETFLCMILGRVEYQKRSPGHRKKEAGLTRLPRVYGTLTTGGRY